VRWGDLVIDTPTHDESIERFTTAYRPAPTSHGARRRDRRVIRLGMGCGHPRARSRRRRATEHRRGARGRRAHGRSPRFARRRRDRPRARARARRAPVESTPTGGRRALRPPPSHRARASRCNDRAARLDARPRRTRAALAGPRAATARPARTDARPGRLTPGLPARSSACCGRSPTTEHRSGPYLYRSRFEQSSRPLPSRMGSPRGGGS
jgi:hypothetical protein